MYVCMYACMGISMEVCAYARMCTFICECMHVCVCSVLCDVQVCMVSMCMYLKHMCIYTYTYRFQGVIVTIRLNIYFNARVAISIEFCNDGSPRQDLFNKLPTAAK